MLFFKFISKIQHLNNTGSETIWPLRGSRQGGYLSDVGKKKNVVLPLRGYLFDVEWKKTLFSP